MVCVTSRLTQLAYSVDGVIQTRIIAIDALDLRWPGRKSQYREELFVRELNKAYVGFMRSPGESITEVATGTEVGHETERAEAITYA